MTQQQEPQLWTSDQIMAYAMTLTNDPNKRALVRRVGLELTHQYEAALAARDERIGALEAENDQMYEQVRVLPVKWGIELGEHKKRIAELEAQLAEAKRWTPVDHLAYEYPSGKSAIVYVDKAANGQPQLRHFIDVGIDNCRETIIPLPAGYRLCRLADAAQTQQAAPDAARGDE